MKTLIISLTMACCVFAANLSESVKKLNWNGIDVVWVEDKKLPVFELVLLFEDGSLSENEFNKGSTDMMFGLLSSGTDKYSQKQILEKLEFEGVKFGGSVYHEYSTYTLSGLVSSLKPSLEMVCHMFNQASFPEHELKKAQKRKMSYLSSLVTNHGSLASRIFRELSLKGSSYSYPVDGKMKDVQSISRALIEGRRDYFLKNVRKRIYIKGPKSALAAQDVLKEKCAWKQPQNASEMLFVQSPSKVSGVHFVEVPKANQAQIRIGKGLAVKDHAQKSELLTFASKYVGGGFTSQLMQEVRVKRGLTYSIGAASSLFKNYGRSFIGTSTKNESLIETLSVIRQTLDSASTSIPQEKFEHSKRYLKGNYLLSLESSSDFMSALVGLDIQQRDYDEIQNFPTKLDSLNRTELAEKIKNLYKKDEQLTLILGDKSLKSKLWAKGIRFKSHKYQDFL